MKRETISDAITNIDGKYIEEAGNYTYTQKTKAYTKNFRTFITFAACFCLIIGGLYLWKQFPFGAHNDSSEEKYIELGKISEEKVSEDGVTIPQLEVELSSSSNHLAESYMLAFFIYQGRSYVQYEWIENGTALVGEYLGTSAGLIDEWTKSDGYVEGAGSIAGDFYSVKGFDPSFMLCMEFEDGTIETFVNNNGFTIKYGSELFEDRLHLENYVSVEYQTRESWYYSQGEPILLSDNYSDIVDEFLNELNISEFMLLSDIPLDENDTNVYDSKEIYHMFFVMENGMTIHLRLFEGGYVSFQGISQICVQIDSEVFSKLIQAFES